MKNFTISFNIAAPDLQHAEIVAQSYANHIKDVPTWVARVLSVSVKHIKEKNMLLQNELHLYKVNIEVHGRIQLDPS